MQTPADGMARPKKKTEVLFIRVEEELATRLRELAELDERKLSPFCARILRRYVADIDANKENK